MSIYSAHVGNLPLLLTDLTTATTNSLGQVAGPFLVRVPSGPGGWTDYAYTPVATAGMFTISASGDGTSVTLP